jgi:hypothetical protein
LRLAFYSALPSGSLFFWSPALVSPVASTALTPEAIRNRGRLVPRNSFSAPRSQEDWAFDALKVAQELGFHRPRSVGGVSTCHREQLVEVFVEDLKEMIDSREIVIIPEGR